MKIKRHSIYDDPSFTAGRVPKYIEWSKDEGEFDCYVDSCICKEINHIADKSIALLIEPRSIQPQVYECVKRNVYKFRYIFTHDDILLSSLTNTRPILFGGVYGSYDEPKTKNISIVSSNKNMCELHRVRTKLCHLLEGNSKVDCYGTYNGSDYVPTRTIYAPYKFSVVIENYIDDYWFTEKICNAFASRTVPIYYGARKIDNYFDSLGIIQVLNPFDIPDLINRMNVDKEYLKRLPGVNTNYELVKKYECFEDWFYLEYSELWRKMINE